MKQGFVILILIAVFGLSQAIFTVDQREQALVLQLGEPVGDIKQPGLHFKIPFVQDVRRFDKRILSVDPEPEQVVVSSAINVETPEKTSEENGSEETSKAPETEEFVSGEPIIVDAFARYKIMDPLKFMKTLRTVENANQRLESIMDDATRGVLGNRTLAELLSEERETVMSDILNSVNERTNDDDLGIEIVDIRIVRADLTPALRQSTVSRMILELKERATETRAKGEERALEIRATAEKERSIILAEGERDAEILRGQGDNEAIKIYADAFNKDPEFYSFIRSMEAYRNTLADPDTRLILSPDSEFFRYFTDIRKRSK